MAGCRPRAVTLKIATDSRFRVVAALSSRPFALLWAGQTISSLGDGAFLTALAWEVLLLTHSATAMGAVVVAGSAPLVAFLLFGGVAADRLPRRLIMLWSDAGRGVLVLIIAVLGWSGRLQLWHLVVLSLLFGVVSAFFRPAYLSIAPQLVESAHLPSANALGALSRGMSQLLGPILGAGFVAIRGPATAFAFDGATFLVSAGLLFAMRLPSLNTPSEVRDQPAAHGIVADLREGMSYVASSPWLWVTIVIVSVGNVGWNGPQIVSLPKLINDTYGQGVWLLGAVATAVAAGPIASTLVVGHARRLRRRGLLAYGGSILSSLAFLIYGAPVPHHLQPAAALCAGALFGFGIGVFEIIWITVLQELVPSDKLGRVSSIDMVGSYCLLPIGYGLAGILTDRFGPPWVFTAGGILNLVLFVLAPILVPSIRQLE